jgi:hypothetical protein
MLFFKVHLTIKEKKMQAHDIEILQYFQTINYSRNNELLLLYKKNNNMYL